jgi:hypothetical protein
MEVWTAYTAPTRRRAVLIQNEHVANIGPHSRVRTDFDRHRSRTEASAIDFQVAYHIQVGSSVCMLHMIDFFSFHSKQIISNIYKNPGQKLNVHRQRDGTICILRWFQHNDLITVSIIKQCLHSLHH